MSPIYHYQVLHVEVLENKSLLELQQLIGDHFGGVKWHWPTYHPHITVAHVAAGVADKLGIYADTDGKEDKRSKIIYLLPEQDGGHRELPVEKVLIKKFRDDSFTPVVISLAACPTPCLVATSPWESSEKSC